jgi:hypothetical protein
MRGLEASAALLPIPTEYETGLNTYYECWNIGAKEFMLVNLKEVNSLGD